MTPKKNRCARCCVSYIADSDMIHCIKCLDDMKESKRQLDRDVLAMGHRDLYEAQNIQLGVALCEKVKARESLARERVAVNGLENDVSRLKAEVERLRALVRELIGPDAMPEVKP